MRRIILAFSLLALTACDARTDARAGADTDAKARSGTPADPAGAGATARSNGATDLAPPTTGNSDAADRAIVFVGTSLTAGYGVGPEAAFPALLQQNIDAAGLPYRVINAGISGETSAGGLRRIDWSLQQPVDVLVLELGANDALRGLDTGQLRANLDAILGRARELHPEVGIVLIGMEAPPNLGSRYTNAFRAVYADLAREYDAALVPFLLEGVAADPALNLEDGIHPNEAGHRILAGTVWNVLEGVLRSRARLSRQD